MKIGDRVKTLPQLGGLEGRVTCVVNQDAYEVMLDYGSLSGYDNSLFLGWQLQFIRHGRENERLNCLLCGTGKSWWRRKLLPIPHYVCPSCEGDPLKGNGRLDWKEYSRARMVGRFGPRMKGDEGLFLQYKEEICHRKP